MTTEPKPRISIVTPSYNQARFLESTLKSILDQNYKNLEYIVMDGGSTDGSVEILKKYSDRLTYWESAPDKGQADAIYRGFKRATGEILCWVNSDDLLLPGSLEIVGDWFSKNPKEEWVVGGSILIDSNGSPILSRRRRLIECDLGLKVTFKRLLFHNCGGFRQPGTFWKRNAFFACGGFDTGLRFCFDYDLYFKLAKRKSSGRISSFLAAFRFHPDSKTSTLNDVCTSENKILWERYGRFTFSKSQQHHLAIKEQRLDKLRLMFLKLRLLAGLVRLPGN